MCVGWTVSSTVVCVLQAADLLKRPLISSGHWQRIVHFYLQRQKWVWLAFPGANICLLALVVDRCIASSSSSTVTSRPSRAHLTMRTNYKPQAIRQRFPRGQRCRPFLGEKKFTEASLVFFPPKIHSESNGGAHFHFFLTFHFDSRAPVGGSIPCQQMVAGSASSCCNVSIHVGRPWWFSGAIGVTLSMSSSKARNGDALFRRRLASFTPLRSLPPDPIAFHRSWTLAIFDT